MAEIEKIPELPAPAKPVTGKPLRTKPVRVKPVKQKKKEKVADTFFLPVLVEFTYTFSVIILILLFLTVVSVSVLTGTKLIDIFFRTTVSMLVVGGLLLMISRQVSMDVLSANITEKEEKEKKEKERLEQEKLEQEKLEQAAGSEMAEEKYEGRQSQEQFEHIEGFETNEEVELPSLAEVQ